MPTKDTELVLSASAIGAYLSCQQKYAYRYEQSMEPVQRAAPLDRGTAMHKAVQAWWKGESPIRTFADWKQDSRRRMNDYEYADFLKDYDHCVQLMGMYAAYYKAPAAGVTIIAQEYELNVRIRPGLRLIGYLDQLATWGGSVWGIEHKTSSRIGNRMSFLHVDPQPTTYIAGLRKMGVPIAGMLWDGINTYPYKDLSAQDPSKLFKRATLLRNDAECEQFWTDTLLVADEIANANKRGTYIRNIGAGCDRCDFKDVCFAEVEHDTVKADAYRRTHFKERKDRR